MIKGCKNFFKWNAIHDFDVFFNAKSVDCFVFSIFHTVPEIIKKTRKKCFYKKPYIRLNIIYFLVNCESFSFFDAEKISKKFIVPAVGEKRRSWRT